MSNPLSGLTNFLWFNSQNEKPEYNPEKQKVDTTDKGFLEEESSRLLNVFDVNQFKYVDSKGQEYLIEKFREDVRDLHLNEQISDFIDVNCRVNPLVSKVYADHLTLADTQVKATVEIEGLDEEESQEFYREYERAIIKLYPDCSTMRDVRKFRLGSIIRYGAFVSQKWFNEITNELEEIRIIPVWALRWKYYNPQWVPYIEGLKTDMYVNLTGFTYCPAFPIINKHGKFFVPPLLAGIASLPAYDMCNQSIENIGRTMGYQKLLKVTPDFNTINSLIEDKGQTTFKFKSKTLEKGIEKSLTDYLIEKAIQIQEAIKKVLKVAVIPVQAGLKIEEGNAFEPPRNLETFKNIIATDVVIGLKSYLSLVGIPGAVNQTTLAETQKETIKNFIETIQQTELSVDKSDFIDYATSKGMIVKSYYAEHEPPSFNSVVEKETARKLKNENDKVEEEDEGNQPENS